jgi:hypothetical protein
MICLSDEEWRSLKKQNEETFKILERISSKDNKEEKQ